jgi:hypothetical protein
LTIVEVLSIHLGILSNPAFSSFPTDKSSPHGARNNAAGSYQDSSG